MYTVKHNSVTGLSGIRHEFADRTDARDYAARRLRSARAQGFPTSTLERGTAWEIGEPEGLHLIPDSVGVLRLVQVFAYRCRECDTGHDSREDAALCCSLEYEEC